MRPIFQSITGLIFIICFMSIAAAQDVSTNAWIDPEIINFHISAESKPYVTFENNNGVYRMEFGRFDSPSTPETPGDPYCYRHGMEPNAMDRVTFLVSTRGGGVLTYKYRFQSYSRTRDDTIYDMAAFFAEALPPGREFIQTIISSPHTECGTYWDSGTREVSFDLDPWKYSETDSFHFSFQLYTDGYGDQTHLSVWDFQIIGCDVIPLTPITDPDAMEFENGNPINTEKLNAATQQGLTCMQQAVADLGGTFRLSSAYRPVSYQAHLLDVWERTEDFKDSKQPAEYCASLQAEVNAEMSKHVIIQEPAMPLPDAPHVIGNAFDATILGLPTPHTVDTVAENCGMYRRIMPNDPVHYEPKPGLIETIRRQFL